MTHAHDPAPRHRHGSVCYLQMPAADIIRSSRFYQAVLGWSVEEGHPGFEAPGIIGQWVTGRTAQAACGVILWAVVDDLEAALASARAHGGAVVTPPHSDGPSRLLALLRDPAGNELGVVQEMSA